MRSAFPLTSPAGGQASVRASREHTRYQIHACVADPAFITDAAEQFVEQKLAAALTEGERQFASSILQTVQRCRQGDLRGAWSVRQSAISRFWDETVFPRMRAYEEAKRSANRKPLAQAGKDLLAVLPSGTHPALVS